MVKKIKNNTDLSQSLADDSLWMAVWEAMDELDTGQYEKSQIKTMNKSAGTWADKP